MKKIALETRDRAPYLLAVRAMLGNKCQFGSWRHDGDRCQSVLKMTTLVCNKRHFRRHQMTESRC